uniref:Uncharacterized protein n=1 Tax=Nelumbo nucifera TaxID=4432 RepID=A0A822YXR8_NELNU|nr:TPA_asm: hypothetical protein HUJ06_007978 [Nelumbo nucifera]
MNCLRLGGSVKADDLLKEEALVQTSLSPTSLVEDVQEVVVDEVHVAEGDGVPPKVVMTGAKGQIEGV